jgi:hypothetical protein
VADDLSILHFVHVICPLLGLLINATSQVLLCRYERGFGLLESIFAGFICGLIMVILIEVAYYCATPSSIAHLLGLLCICIITYVTLSYCYFHFVNLGETARRVRILRELYDSKDGLSMEEILNRYNANDIIEKRIRRLLFNGQIILKDGRYFPGNSTVLLMNKAMVIMKIVVLGKRSEFD